MESTIFGTIYNFDIIISPGTNYLMSEAFCFSFLKVYNDTIIYCPDPVDIYTSNVDIKYPHTNYQSQRGHEVLNISRVFEPVVTQAFPLMGAVTGGTTVSMSGVNFIPTPNLKCNPAFFVW